MPTMKVRRIDFSPSEWLEGSTELSDTDRGIYITICALIWARGGPIGIELLQAHSRSHGNAVLASVVRLEKARKIVRKGSEIGQKRAENELENARKRFGNRSENGAKGNKIRWGSDRYAIPFSDRSRARPHPDHQPSEEESRGLESPTLSEKLDSSQPFAIEQKQALNGAFSQCWKKWWEQYPHKVGKLAAEKSYRRALARASPDLLLSALDRYVATKPADVAWCNPATWLNQGRWLDEPSTIGSAVPERSTPRGPAPKIVLQPQ